MVSLKTLETAPENQAFSIFASMAGTVPLVTAASLFPVVSQDTGNSVNVVLQLQFSIKVHRMIPPLLCLLLAFLLQFLPQEVAKNFSPELGCRNILI